MKLSKTALMELSQQYRSILKRCFCYNLAALVVVGSAEATELTPVDIKTQIPSGYSVDADILFSDDEKVIVSDDSTIYIDAQRDDVILTGGGFEIAGTLNIGANSKNRNNISFYTNQTDPMYWSNQNDSLINIVDGGRVNLYSKGYSSVWMAKDYPYYGWSGDSIPFDLNIEKGGTLNISSKDIPVSWDDSDQDLDWGVYLSTADATVKGRVDIEAVNNTVHWYSNTLKLEGGELNFVLRDPKKQDVDVDIHIGTTDDEKVTFTSTPDSKINLQSDYSAEVEIETTGMDVSGTMNLVSAELSAHNLLKIGNPDKRSYVALEFSDLGIGTRYDSPFAAMDSEEREEVQSDLRQDHKLGSNLGWGDLSGEGSNLVNSLSGFIRQCRDHLETEETVWWQLPGNVSIGYDENNYFIKKGDKAAESLNLDGEELVQYYASLSLRDKYALHDAVAEIARSIKRHYVEDVGGDVVYKEGGLITINNTTLTATNGSEINQEVSNNLLINSSDITLNKGKQYSAVISHEGKTGNIEFNDSVVNLNNDTMIIRGLFDWTTKGLFTSIGTNESYGDIVFDHSTLNMNGTSSVNLSDTNGLVVFQNDSVINVFGNNKINLQNNSSSDAFGGAVALGDSESDESTLNIHKGATLTLVQAKNGFKDLEDGTIYPSLLYGTESSKINIAGTFVGDVNTLGDITFNGTKAKLKGKIVSANSLTFENSKGEIKNLIGASIEDLSSLSIHGSGSYTLNNPTFLQSTKDPEKQIAYMVGYGEPYPDINLMTQEEAGDYTDNVKVAPVDNRVNHLTLTNKASLNTKKTLFADEISLDNATFTATNAMGFSELNADHKSVINLSGYSHGTLNEHIVLNDASTINLSKNEFYIGQITANEGSTVNITNSPLSLIPNLELNDSNYIQSNSQGGYIGDFSINGHSTAKITNSILSGDELNTTGSATMTLDKNTQLGFGSFNLNQATMLSNNSEFGAISLAVWRCSYLDDLTYYIAGGSGEIGPELNIKNSDLTLNGKSTLKSTFQYVDYGTKKDTYTDISYDYLNTNKRRFITYAENQQTAQQDLDDLLNTSQNINIQNSKIVLNGTSAIVNNSLSTANNTGHINLTEGSVLEAKGKNLLSTTGLINLTNSTLNLAKGATLTIDSNKFDAQNKDTISLNNATLMLAGTLNGNLKGSVSSLVLSKTFKLNGLLDLDEDIGGFGVSGISSAKDLVALFDVFKNYGGNTQFDAFTMSDKSKFSTSMLPGSVLNTDSFNVLNQSTLTIDKDTTIKNLLVDNSSLVIKNSSFSSDATDIKLNNSSLTVTGDAKKMGAQIPDVMDFNELIVDNADNAKATVKISNMELWGDMDLNNTSTITLNNIHADGLSVDTSKNLTISKSLIGETILTDVQKFSLNDVKVLNEELSINVSEDNKTETLNPDTSRQKVVYQSTGTLTNTIMDDLTLDNVYLTLNKGVVINGALTLKDSYHTGSNRANNTYVAVKDNLVVDSVALQGGTLSVAKGKTLTVLDGLTITPEDPSSSSGGVLSLSGTLKGDITDTCGESVEILNSSGKIDGKASLQNTELRFQKTKGNLSDYITKELQMGGFQIENGSNLTLDKYFVGANSLAYNMGGLKVIDSQLHLTDRDIFVTGDLDTKNAKLYLGSNTLTVDGTAFIGANSTIYADVVSWEKYGQLKADTLKLETFESGKNQGKVNNISLAVTMPKNSEGVIEKGDIFNFLDYTTLTSGTNEDIVDSIKVSIANNRYEFTEVAPGQFEVTDITSGKGVIKKFTGTYSNPNKLMSVANAYVDTSAPFASAKQGLLAEQLNKLSQIVGQENNYVEALDALSPQDEGMIQGNELSTVDTMLNTVSNKMSSGLSVAGLNAGDVTGNRGSMWGQGLYNYTRLDKNTHYHGFKGKSQGMALGVEANLTENLKSGLAYHYTNTDIRSGQRRMDVDTHGVALYSEYKPNNWFINGILGFALSKYDEKSNSLLGTTSSDFDVYTYSAQATTGYEVSVNDNLKMTPHIGLRYALIDQQGYKDSQDQKVSANTNDFVTFRLGDKLSWHYQTSQGVSIIPELHLGISYDLHTDHEGAVVRLSNGGSYQVNDRALKRFGVNGGIATKVTADDWDFIFGYDVETRQDYRSHTGSLKATYHF